MFAIGVSLTLAGCAVQPAEGPRLQAVAITTLPGWSSDNLAEAMPALRRSCERWALMPQDQALGGSGQLARDGGHAGQWAGACTAARAVPPGNDAAARAFLATWFRAYEVEGTARYTGYYEPELPGALHPTARFATPVLARPADLVRQGDAVGRLEGGRLVPYYDRAAIEGGALDGQGLELLYLESPQALFFLQIQGSGRVVLPDGQVVRLVFAGQNGRPYVPIGRVLAERGAIPPAAVSMQSVRAWLDAHPGQAGAVMDANSDYVFFRTDPDAAAAEGPPGTLGVALVPGRSAAVDRRAIPLGAPLWVDAADPLTDAPLQRLVLAQDTGTDIRGALRADLFFGWGAQAEDRAGRMRETGREYVLLPRA